MKDKSIRSVPQKYIFMLDSDQQDQELAGEYFQSNDIHAVYYYHTASMLKSLKISLGDNGLLPGLILMNINTVPGDAIEILKEIKSNEFLQHIPVVVLGQNAPAQIIMEVYKAGANTFVNKPFTFALTEHKI